MAQGWTLSFVTENEKIEVQVHSQMLQNGLSMWNITPLYMFHGGKQWFLYYSYTIFEAGMCFLDAYNFKDYQALVLH